MVSIVQYEFDIVIRRDSLKKRRNRLTLSISVAVVDVNVGVVDSFRQTCLVVDENEVKENSLRGQEGK
jgi:phage terminase large subunit-like protein